MKKVMVFGTFDIVHMGHIHMFKQAREYGDYLTVVVGRDCNVGKKLVHNQEERLEFLKYIKIIDKVMLGFEDNKFGIIGELKPDVIALGYDQEASEEDLKKYITKIKLQTKIIRLKPYLKNKFKTNKIKQYIESII